MDIPDIDEIVGKLPGWRAFLTSAWRYLGFPLGGSVLAVAGGMHLKGDLLHHVLGIPTAVVVLDSVTLWAICGAVLIGLSLLATGLEVVRQSTMLANKKIQDAVAEAERKVCDASAKAEQEVVAAGEERDNWKVDSEAWKENYRRLEKAAQEYAADRDSHKAELTKLKAELSKQRD